MFYYKFIDQKRFEKLPTLFFFENFGGSKYWEKFFEKIVQKFFFNFWTGQKISKLVSLVKILVKNYQILTNFKWEKFSNKINVETK